MNKTSNQQKIALLRKVKKVLARTPEEFWGWGSKKKQRFICIALESVANGGINDPDARELIGMISNRLLYSTLEVWLIEAGFLGKWRYPYTDEDVIKIQNTRLAWIDSLIEELS